MYQVSFIVIEYRFVLFVRLVLNVHFCPRRFTTIICFISFTHLLHIFTHLFHWPYSFIYHFIHVPIICVYTMPILLLFKPQH